MDIEELRAEKLEECKREMYEDMLHERLMSEDWEYALESVADELDEAYEILRKASDTLFDYGYNVSPIDLIKEI